METLKSIIEGVVVTAMLAGAYSIGVSVGQEVTRPEHEMTIFRWSISTEAMTHDI